MGNSHALQFVKDTAAFGGVVALLVLLVLIVKQNEDSLTLMMLSLGVVIVGAGILCTRTRFLDDQKDAPLRRAAFAALVCVVGIVATIVAREVSLAYGYIATAALCLGILTLLVSNK